MLSCLILVVTVATVTAQGWRGIVPLHSSCDDVKRKLGIAECQNRTYDLVDSKVSILFSDGRCASGWDVPAGTVITLDIHSKVPQRISDVSLDPSYRKVIDAHLPGLTRYENDDRSVSITVSPEGFVTEYFYGPSTKDESLRCRPQPSGTGSIKFDEYGLIPKKEEETRLNNFAFQLKSTDRSFLGYILVYAGQLTSIKEAHQRGVRVKAYLVKRGVEATRLFIVDGGYREESTVELFVTIRDTIPPTPRPTISRDPSANPRMP
jgi:hypothetical protein